MTTAHRATWKAARGGLQEEGSFRLHVPSAAVSSKDAPTELILKERAPTDDSREELRARLEPSEQPLPKRPRKSRFGPALEIQHETPPSPQLGVKQTPSGNLQQSSDVDDKDRKADNLSAQNPKNSSDHVSAPDSENGDSDADSDDDEADLLAELETIRREREYERAKKQAEEEEREEQENIARAALGNPLLGPLPQLGGEFSDTASIATGSVPVFAVRRRWNDDVIFRNETASETHNKPRFINDTIRNDFHRKFMKRHIK